MGCLATDATHRDQTARTHPGSRGSGAAGPRTKRAQMTREALNSVTSAPTISSIEDGRTAIDKIDTQLRALVGARLDVSRQIQALRSADGGPRIEHSRENEIIAAWSGELGPRGVEIALSILTLCRGSLT
ncbi:chorismate mutase [Frankia sp. Cas3]|uniref:chorismate mutase n=1 Tax=Frankia sp. Cas3 TaxID=3073926 RepID=UPI002AD2EF21|nr:chorismate mutase [Frankia sp. Cas3]